LAVGGKPVAHAWLQGRRVAVQEPLQEPLQEACCGCRPANRALAAHTCASPLRWDGPLSWSRAWTLSPWPHALVANRGTANSSSGQLLSSLDFISPTYPAHHAQSPPQARSFARGCHPRPTLAAPASLSLERRRPPTSSMRCSPLQNDAGKRPQPPS